MKAIKSILLISFVFICGVSFAQPPNGGQRGGQQDPPPIPNDKQIEEMVSDLANEIALSSQQEVKILEIYKEHFAQVKEKTSGNSRPNREEMEAMKTTFEKKVKAELTKEQTGKYEAVLKKQTSQRPKR